MKRLFGNTTMLMGVVLTLGLSAHAGTVSVTFIGTPTGVNDGADYVMPYQLNINGVLTDATCYDIFDNVTGGQSWTANALTLNQAAATGQFGGGVNSLSGYEEVAFLSLQTTNSSQNQVDLQHDIWNVFGSDTYSVTTGMQHYLDMLATPAYANFDFGRVLFLEDVSRRERAQAFVIDPPTASPEPGTIVLIGAGALLIGIGRIRRQKRLK
jgi:hypothetical protein